MTISSGDFSETMLSACPRGFYLERKIVKRKVAAAPVVDLEGLERDRRLKARDLAIAAKLRATTDPETLAKLLRAAKNPRRHIHPAVQEDRQVVLVGMTVPASTYSEAWRYLRITSR